MLRCISPIYAVVLKTFEYHQDGFGSIPRGMQYFNFLLVMMTISMFYVLLMVVMGILYIDLSDITGVEAFRIVHILSH